MRSLTSLPLQQSPPKQPPRPSFATTSRTRTVFSVPEKNLINSNRMSFKAIHLFKERTGSKLCTISSIPTTVTALSSWKWSSMRLSGPSQRLVAQPSSPLCMIPILVTTSSSNTTKLALSSFSGFTTTPLSGKIPMSSSLRDSTPKAHCF